MANDWIKMRKCLLTDPRIVRIMSATNADKFRTLGGLFAVWCLFDEQTIDGYLPYYTPEHLDDIVGFPGIAQAMVSVGWLEVTTEGLTAIEFLKHNGQTAKRRASESVRKMSARNADKRPQNVRSESRQNAGLEKRREEKKKEDIKTPLAPVGGTDASKPTPTKPQLAELPLPHSEQFAQTWEEWIEYRKSRRLTLGPATLARQLKDLASLSEASAIQCVEDSIRNGWQGLFPEKYRQNANTGNANTGPQRPKTKTEIETEKMIEQIESAFST